MFLKSLEIKGFKSFADKTEILFKDGITAIVGPNGSGKSNITDAVRWVLGEQSIKSLRGGKMEDVIFAGTQFRKPVNLSQVSIVLGNEDMMLPIEYTDVKITRRLYRSGESDYFINNTRCRLKDIQELFMDTGIGREGYSIIGQGKIEAILSGRQEDKRGLLEEAAGIVKFRTRKEEAEKKLNTVNQNLIRIDDILSTYTDRLAPLEEDAKKAEIFLKLSENLKRHEVNMLIFNIENCEKNIKNISEKTYELTTELTKLKNSGESISKNNKHFENELEKIEAFQEEKSKEIYSLKVFCQKLEAETEIFKERESNLKANIERNKIEIKTIDNQIESAAESCSKLYAELDDERKKNNLIDEKIIETSNIISDVENEIAAKLLIQKDLREKNLEMLQKISAIKNKISTLENIINEQKAKIKNIDISNENLKKMISSNMEIQKNLEEEKKKSILKSEEFEKQLNSGIKTTDWLEHIICESEDKLKNLNMGLSKMEANRAMLANMEKKHEGYNKAVKLLMQDIEVSKAPVNKNSCFLIGDILEVPKQYETAIDIALGNSISDVITKDAESAKILIEYLKSNNLGRATFLPLSIIRPKKVDTLEALSKINGYIGIASNLVKYDSMFENAVKFLLGKTIICTNLDIALEIASKTSYSYKIVTLTGEVINPSGSLTGGSLYNKNSSIISRKREIEELSLSIEKSMDEIQKLSSKMDEYKNKKEKISKNVKELNANILAEKISITKITEKITAVNSSISELKDRLAKSVSEIEKTNTAIKDNISELEKLKVILNDNCNTNALDNGEIESIEAEIKSRNDFMKQQREIVLDYKIKKAKSEEMISRISENIKRIENEAEGYKKRKLKIAAENESSEKSVKECLKKIEDNNNLLKEKSEIINLLQSEIEKLNIQRIKLKDDIKLAVENSESLFSEIAKKENELHKIDIQREKYETEKEIYLGKLNEEMGLTYAEALSYKTDIKNINEFKENISKMKSEISRLGAVNLGAIEEYKEIKEKIAFMTIQRNDLNNSKYELEKLIEEMTKKMRIIFKENFANIRSLFNETFQELFSGGKADLVLTDGDELNGSIEIEVQPPGKKLQNINLLSGGEKGLAAIALLFAILKMKPTPFCILDEIEASLDDANVRRYADFLKRFSKNTQFIVITHRKGTMEVSNALYGITMEEKGVSKVMSVELGG